VWFSSAKYYNDLLMEIEKRQQNLPLGFYQSMNTIAKTAPMSPVLSKELEPKIFPMAKRAQVVWGPIPMAAAGVSLAAQIIE
jgi:hypothetical protein